jgi:hypothetical protein
MLLTRGSSSRKQNTGLESKGGKKFSKQMDPISKQGYTHIDKVDFRLNQSEEIMKVTTY